jgi:hypothetical protein
MTTGLAHDAFRHTLPTLFREGVTERAMQAGNLASLDGLRLQLRDSAGLPDDQATGLPPFHATLPSGWRTCIHTYSVV